jgi:hypothetical protein
MCEHSNNYKGHETQWAMMMTGKAMDSEDALKFLSEDFPIRSLEEILCETVGYYRCGKWVEVTPTEARSVLLEKMGRDYEQKINGWLPPNDESRNKKRVERITIESAMQIAFSLKFSLEEVEELLRRCWLDSLYLRNVRDIIYKCGLDSGFNLNDVEALINEFSYLDKPNPNPEYEKDIEEDSITRVIISKLENSSIACPNDLRAFIKRNEKLFGSYRMRAYSKMMELYGQIKSNIEYEYIGTDIAESYAAQELIEDNEYEIDESVVGVRSVISQEDLLIMLSSGISELKSKIKSTGLGNGLSAVIRKHIVENIPGRAEWSGTINQRADKDTGAIRGVDRKLMILIWLSSYDGSLDGDPDADDDEGFLGFAGNPGTTSEQAFENHVEALNGILSEYGFPLLDPRHPFDWVILNTLHYAHILRKGEDSTDIPMRLENLFKQL